MSEPERRLIRVETRFSEPEIMAAADEIKRYGSTQKTIIAVWRAHFILSTPAFSDGEVRVLYASNRALDAIGNNLNQIARTLNAGGKAPAPDLADLRKEIKAHTAKVTALCNAVMDRWAK